MKKRFILISIILVISINLILTSVVQASNSKTTITIDADKEQIKPGDEIAYTISIQTTEEVSALDVRLDIPSGLTLVKDSGKIEDSNLTNNAITNEFSGDKICIVRMDTVTLSGNVTLATFKCKADPSANGDYKIGFKLLEITAGDDDHIVPDDECLIVNKSINVNNAEQESKDNEEIKNEISSAKEDATKEDSIKEDKKDKTPKTGDNSNVILWGSLCIIAVICFIAIARWNTKK